MADLTLNEINDGYKGGSLTDEEIVRAMLAQFAREYHRIFPLEGENETWDILLKKKTENTLTMLKKNQAYKESLSFTNDDFVEKTVEVLASKCPFRKTDKCPSIQCTSADEDNCWMEHSMAIVKALSPYLSTIEQAKKEGK